VGEASYEEISHLGFTEASGSRLSSDDMDPCGSHCEQNWIPRILRVLFPNDVLHHSGAPGWFVFDCFGMDEL